MRWFKVAAVALGVLIVLLVVSSVIGFLIEAVIAVLVVAVIALGIKAAFYEKRASGKMSDREICGPANSSLLYGIAEASLDRHPRGRVAGPGPHDAGSGNHGHWPAGRLDQPDRE